MSEDTACMRSCCLYIAEFTASLWRSYYLYMAGGMAGVIACMQGFAACKRGFAYLALWNTWQATSAMALANSSPAKQKGAQK